MDKKEKDNSDIVSYRSLNEDSLVEQLSLYNLVKQLLPYYRPYSLLVIAILFAGAVGTGLPLRCIPQYAMIISFTKTGNTETMIDHMRIYIPVLLAIGVFVGVSQMLNRCIVYFLSSKMMIKMRSDVYSSMINQPMTFFNNNENSTGNLTAVLAEEMRTINSASLDVYFVLFQGMVGMVTGFIISLSYSLHLGLIALVVLPLTF